MLSGDLRSQTGCWTCRTRRKKCDEAVNSCKNCVSLQLTCYGYGRKPSWMDGGEREKAKVLEFKTIVKRVAKSRRRSRTISQTSDVHVNWATGSNTHINLTQDQDPGQAHSTQPQASQNVDRQMQPVETLPISTHDMDYISPVQLLSPITPTHPSSSYFDPDNAESLMFWHENLDSEHLSPSTIDTTFPEVPDLGTSEPVDTSSNSSEQDVAPNSTFLDSESQNTSVSQHNETITQDDQIAIEMYIRYTLVECFPMLDANAINDIQSSLRQLCRRRPAVRDAILYISTIFTSMQYLDLTGAHFAVKESDKQRKRKLESTLVDHWYELMTPGGLDMGESIVFIAILAPALLQGKMPQLSVLPKKYIHTCPRKSMGALAAFQDRLVYLELLTCTVFSAVRSYPFEISQDTYSRGLNNLDFESFAGCNNNLVACIKEISTLAQWKRRESATKTISLLNLAKKGLTTDENLDRAILDGQDSGSICEQTTPTRKITLLYASAAKIYLHAIMSGAEPSVPEIATAVSKGIELIKQTPCIHILKILAWPLCLVASLADQDHIPFFEQLETELSRVCGSSHPVMQAFGFAKLCWTSQGTKISDSGRDRTREMDWCSLLEIIDFQGLIV